jgi:16S rRNA (uracil1498-N3)-methyltransferase
MECLYFQNLVKNISAFSLDHDENKHLKVLRVKENETILVTNGKKLSAVCKVNYQTNWQALLTPIEFFENYSELPVQIDLLCCKISDKDRLEFLVEKSTELGVNHFYIVDCKYSQPSNININRLQSKALAAMKQSKRSVLPEFSLNNNVLEISTNLIDYEKIILLDENGIKPINIFNGSISKEHLVKLLIVVGPEGGLHNDEIKQFEKLINIDKLIKWNLGNRRLRTETAAIKALSILTNFVE